MEFIFSILAWLQYLFTSPTFWIIYLIPSFGLVHFGLKSLKPLIPRTDGDRERDEKYHAFRRHDLDKINNLMIYLQAPLVLTRWIIGWS
jgi:hypothetical protein